MADFNMDEFVSAMKGFQASDEARQRLFADMLDRYTALLEEHANLKNDYASERDIRRNYQKSVDQMRRLVDDTQREMENSSFVLALIDGDGVIFQDALLQAAPNDGGSEAASRLHYAIREHIASLYSNSGNWPIMVQIYLCLDKLAQKLASVGMLHNPQELRAFAQRFSVNQSLFSIIDVGHGKERADHKIKEMLRTFSDNPTCKHIIFGGCHDAGYLLNLDQYKHHAGKAARITLLESTPAFRGFTDLPNFKWARFDDVFRKDPLPEAAQYANQYGYGAHSAAPRASTPSTQPPGSGPAQLPFQPTFKPPTQTTQTSIMRTPANGSPAPAAALANASETPAASSPSTTHSSLAANPTISSTSAPDASDSWASVGKTGVPPKESIPITPKHSVRKKYIYYNKVGERLDEPLPLRDRAAAEAIDRRMQKMGRNLCNHWHLNRGRCGQGSACYFQHEPKLSPAETVALKYKTRSLACKDRYCENFECYLGHQCSFERDQGYCPFPDKCNLKHTHGMDKVKYERWDAEGNQELLVK